MVSVYVSEDVRRVRKLHAELLDSYPGKLLVGQVLRAQAETLFHAHRAGNSAACVQLSNWLPDCVGLNEEQILRRRIDPGDALLTVAREHGFNSWLAVEEVAQRPLVADFERSVDLMLAGDADALKAELVRQPHLLNWRSAYGHRATLLHYLSANGVETWRQVVPCNAPQLACMLIAAGADPAATASMYGGAWVAEVLVRSSAHPREAGVAEALSTALQSG